MTFGAIDELPFADVDAWQDHALPVAGPHAYPLPADMKRDGSMRRPDARGLTHAEALLRALSETTEDELDAGTWQKRVQTFDGPIELTLSLPFLLEAEAGRPTTCVAPMAMPRVAERESVRIARLLEGRAFESLEAVNAELERLNQEDVAPKSPAREPRRSNAHRNWPTTRWRRTVDCGSSGRARRWRSPRIAPTRGCCSLKRRRPPTPQSSATSALCSPAPPRSAPTDSPRCAASSGDISRRARTCALGSGWRRHSETWGVTTRRWHTIVHYWS